MDWNTPDYQARMDAEYERIRAKHPTLVTHGFECLAGWYPILEAYFDEVARLIEAHPGSKLRLQQVKEKFGA